MKKVFGAKRMMDAKRVLDVKRVSDEKSVVRRNQVAIGSGWLRTITIHHSLESLDVNEGVNRFRMKLVVIHCNQFRTDEMPQNYL